MNATQLWDTTMNPESRTLLCVTIENAMMAEKRVTELMGNEGNGVRDETIAMSDASLYIPIDTMESLNVGVAAGIVMYTFKEVSL